MERETRKKEYLEKFLGAFAENGLDRTSIKKLAAAAQINEASIYRYFADKDAIVVACVQRYFDTVREKVFPVLSDAGRPLEERLQEAENWRSRLEKREKFVIQVLAHPLYGGLCRGAARTFRKDLAELVKRMSRQEKIPWETAQSLFFLLFGILTAERIYGEGRSTLRQAWMLVGRARRARKRKTASEAGAPLLQARTGEAEN